MSETITVDVNLGSISKKIQSVLDDTQANLAIHNLLAKMCDPYVPMESGMLVHNINVTPYYVQYISPYAHYMYKGVVYEPNIAVEIDPDTGQVLKWRSKPGVTKQPTGRTMQYNTVWYKDLTTGQFYPEQRQALHPLATKEWDKAMMIDKGEEFTKQVKDILVRRAKELYG